MTYQATQTDCGCQPTCCDRHLAPVQNNASSCCEPTQAAGASCGCTTPAAEKATLVAAPARHLIIEFLYLDLSACTRCQQSEASLDEAIANVEDVLAAAGVEVTTRKIHVQSEDQARQLGFVTSPTIRLNGQDIQLDFKESACDSCSCLSGTETACRTWTYQGQEYTAPPKAMVVEAILKAVYGGPEIYSRQPAGQELPANLKRFFSATRQQPVV
jgi:hypothetical protein